jgi:hypothetical protein
MIFINLQDNYLFRNYLVMSSSCDTKKSKKGKGVLYFFAITALTAFACIYVIKEGQRIKIENELLSYEVW